jgi:hypothetical protein
MVLCKVHASLPSYLPPEYEIHPNKLALFCSTPRFHYRSVALTEPQTCRTLRLPEEMHSLPEYIPDPRPRAEGLLKLGSYSLGIIVVLCKQTAEVPKYLDPLKHFPVH